jgi:hypothetical protein
MHRVSAALIERIITLEDHFLAEGYLNLMSVSNQGEGILNSVLGRFRNQLEDLDSIRLRDMETAGIDMQIISNLGPNLPLSLSQTEEIMVAQEANNQLAAAIAAHPDRFAGFATLPMSEPQAASKELERAVRALGMKGAMVFGTTKGRFLDDVLFLPILERASALEVPIYIHPAPPPEAVRNAYYSGFQSAVNVILAGPGWGWHQEVGIHVLRLALAGVFDKLPNLHIIIGHMGEMIPFMFERSDHWFSPVLKHLRKPLRDYMLENVYVTTSGIFSEAVMDLALRTFGVDRILFSVDYPFDRNEIAVAFLNNLSTVTADEKEKIAHLNAERALKLKPKI